MLSLEQHLLAFLLVFQLAALEPSLLLQAPLLLVLLAHLVQVELFLLVLLVHQAMMLLPPE